jgi:outer membrane protein
MKLTKSLGGLIVLLIVVMIGLNVHQLRFAQKKIVYVRSYDLIEKYQGTLEARKNFAKRQTQMQANVDSLRMDFERSRNEYIRVAAALSASVRVEREKILTQQQQQFLQYQQAIDEKIQEEDSKMMQEVLNQVNSFIEGYALRNGYDLILGTTMSGNVLFGDKALDITDELLVEINDHYKGK